MKSPVEFLGPQDTVLTAARQMRDRNIEFLPVCDRNRHVLGTITDRDIALRLVAPNRPATTPVSEIMSRDVIVCRPDDDVRAVAALLRHLNKPRLVCVDARGGAVGIVSLSDIEQQGDGAPAAESPRRTTAYDVNPR